MEGCSKWKQKYCRLGVWNEQAGCSDLLFQGTFSYFQTNWNDLFRNSYSLWGYVGEFWKGINRISYAQTVVIPIVVFIQILLLLRYLRLDRVMGTLLQTITHFLKELAKLLLLMVILMIPYGLIQENFLYPNQYLTT